MRETMGQIIRRLRKERNLTQEELAEQLNISAAAVSKWENDTSMPDISQVVPLANFFGVQTDVLFDVSGKDAEADIRARLDEIYRMCDGCKDGEEAPTALIILDKYREAIRLYPGNANLKTEAMAFYSMVMLQNGEELKALIGEEGIEALTQEVIGWAELVIRYSNDVSRILSAKERLIEIYVRQNRRSDAYAVAETFPDSLARTRGILMADLNRQFGDREGERKQRCSNVEWLADKLGGESIMLGNLYMNEEKWEDALYCYNFQRSMVDALYGEEGYRPPFHMDYMTLYRFPAVCLMKLGRKEEALALLEEGVRFILTQAEHYNKKNELDIPLLRDCHFSYGWDGNASYTHLKQRLHSLIGGDDFAILADDPRYRALIEIAEAQKE